MGRTEQAKAKVLAGGAEVLHESGVPAFTVEAVAKKSGVAKTTIYRHWTGSTDLLVDTLRTMIHPLPTPNTGSLHADLAELYRLMMPCTMHETTEQARLMFGLLQAALDDDDLDRALDDLLRERIGPITTILELARARGEIDPDTDLDLAVDLVEGPLLHRYLLRRELVTDAEVAVVLRHVVAGLRPVPSDTVNKVAALSD